MRQSVRERCGGMPECAREKGGHARLSARNGFPPYCGRTVPGVVEVTDSKVYGC